MRSEFRPSRLLLAVVLGVLASSIGRADASFTYSPGDLSPATQVQFTDTSTPRPIDVFWNFGDPASGTSNTSSLRNPTHTFSQAGDYTVQLILRDSRKFAIVHVAAAGNCHATDTVMCLNGNRFAVSANWTKNTGQTGSGTGIPLTDDSGYFWFFDDANIEMVVKVLNACGSSLGNAYWVFAAGLTDVQVNWQVLDTQNGATFVGVNPQGTPFAPVQRTDAFPTSCP